MKKLLIAVIAITSVVAISSCAKDRIYGCTNPFSINYNPNASDDDGSCFIPSSQKHALIGDFTGTWCPWCGEWGGPEFENCINASGSNAVPMGIHVGDEMTTDMTTEYDSYYTTEGVVGGYPTLYVWNQGTFSDGNTMAGAVSTEVATGPAEAGAVAGYTDNGTSITLSISAQLFADVTGDYFVVGYLMENGINIPQEVESLGPDYDPAWIHDHVIRASSNGTTWGEQWVFASGTNGQTFTKSYQVEKNANWNMANMYCIAIVWKYDEATAKYTYVNAQETHL